MKNTYSVPKNMKEKFDEITELIKSFSKEYLNEEYEDLCIKLCAALSRKRPSPLLKGKASTWACGIIHAIGTINFLFDPTQSPSIKVSTIYNYFQISSGTGSSKSREIRKMMDMHHFHPEWSLRSIQEDSPLNMLPGLEELSLFLDSKVQGIKNHNVIEFGISKKKLKKVGVNSKSQALELVSDAYESYNPMERVLLAKEAIKLWPDCTEAFIILGEEADCPKKALEYYKNAVEAGERELGDDKFKELTGHFWLALETRSYMRAKLSYAEMLRFFDKRHEAIENLKEMLVLNPNDNQGVRHILINWLMLENYDEDLEKLLSKYNRDFYAGMYYTHALLYFKKGNKKDADLMLKKAIEKNKYVPAYLTGKRKIPKELPQFMTPGEENEAIAYADEGIDVWRSVPKALNWLKDTKF